MKIDLKGVTRIVFVFDKFVIKIPNFIYQHNHFLRGCVANWEERNYYKQYNKLNFEGNMIEYTAPSYFCSWFGLIQIQAKCEPMLEHLTDEQIEFYKELHKGDFKKENFGWYKGKLVCLDYN